MSGRFRVTINDDGTGEEMLYLGDDEQFASDLYGVIVAMVTREGSKRADDACTVRLYRDGEVERLHSQGCEQCGVGPNDECSMGCPTRTG